jgi:hypothetical protein
MNRKIQDKIPNLEDCFGEFARTLPLSESQGITFSTKSFAEGESLLATEEIVIRKGYADYNGFRADRLQFFASKVAYRELGLLITSVVFRPGGSRVQLALTQPSSNIKNLIIEYSGTTPRVSGHHTKPEKFLFCPERITTHPWKRENPDVFGFPVFTLTNINQFVATEEQWAGRDTVIGFGNDDASIRLGALLLNFGSPDNDTLEVTLEGEGGFRGVGVHSTEAAFYLPGSIAWPDGVELSSLFST